jgi:hypothetical protein
VIGKGNFIVADMVIGHDVVIGKYIMYYLRRKEGSAVSQLNCERDLRILDTLHLIDDAVASKCPKIGEISGFEKHCFGWLQLFL